MITLDKDNKFNFLFLSINKVAHGLKPSISYSRNSYSSEYQFKSSDTFVPHQQLQPQPQQGWNDGIFNQGFSDASPLQTNHHVTCEITNYDWSVPSQSFNYSEPSLQANTGDFVQYNPVPGNTYQANNGYYQQANTYQSSYSACNQEYSNSFPSQRYTAPTSG